MAGVNGGTAPATEAPRLEITTSRQFMSWLAGSGGSRAFTTHQSGKVFLIGSGRHEPVSLCRIACIKVYRQYFYG